MPLLEEDERRWLRSVTSNSRGVVVTSKSTSRNPSAESPTRLVMALLAAAHDAERHTNPHTSAASEKPG